MILLNYANPLHNFTSGNLTYTATKECYLVGSLPMRSGVLAENKYISIDNTKVGIASQQWQGDAGFGSSDFIFLKLKVGQIVTVGIASDNLHIFEEI